MMIKLPTPFIDSHSLLDAIVLKKHRETREMLLLIKDDIKARYRFYEEHYNTLEAIHPLNSVWDLMKDELLSCYGNNVSFQAAKKALFDAMPLIIQNSCPYCLLNRPNTLDHYFDKSDYPEYAVFIPNLVPCCSECNTIKGTLSFNSVGRRNFIHFYHDQVPCYQFLFIRFSNTDKDVIPEITIVLDFQQEEPINDIITSHFENLELLKKYKNAINVKLSVIIREIMDAQTSGFTYDNLQTLLENRHCAMVEHYGINHWESCIYEGILHSANFLKNVLS